MLNNLKLVSYILYIKIYGRRTVSFDVLFAVKIQPGMQQLEQGNHMCLGCSNVDFFVVAFFTVQSQCDMGFAFPSIPHIRHGTCSCTVLERKEKCTTLVAI